MQSLLDQWEELSKKKKHSGLQILVSTAPQVPASIDIDEIVRYERNKISRDNMDFQVTRLMEMVQSKENLTTLAHQLMKDDGGDFNNRMCGLLACKILARAQIPIQRGCFHLSFVPILLNMLHDFDFIARVSNSLWQEFWNTVLVGPREMQFRFLEEIAPEVLKQCQVPTTATDAFRALIQEEKGMLPSREKYRLKDIIDRHHFLNK